ncbi:hypothetical protein VPHK406_0025 [Vibrio phage K406]
MPKKVSDLTLVERSELTNLYQVVVTNPLDYTLVRCPTTSFRGASNFTSVNEPTTTPEDPTIPEYIQGDTYQHATEKGLLQYTWDNVNKVWSDPVKLNGLRVLTATDFPDEINLDLRDTNFTTPIAYANDYYLNKTANLLYQYSPANGFQFGSTTFEGYQGFRAPHILNLQGDDVTGYLDIVSYVQAYLDGGVVSDTVKREYYHPIHQDIFKLELENDQGHGGWYWTFDADQGIGVLQQYYDCLNAKLGIDFGDIDGTSILSRKHWREDKTWNQTDVPVQNDKKYRQGDNVFVTEKGILYYNYQEGQPDNTADLGLLFEGQTTLKGSSLLNALDTGGNWVSPTSNDADYTEGDFILTRNLGTPRIHGPYKFGAATDLEAWPLYAVLRSPVKHTYTAGASLPTTYGGDYPVSDEGVMIVEGDDLYIRYSADKTYVYEGAASVGYGETPPEKTVTWDQTNRRAFHQILIKTSASVADPSIDNSVYYDGQLVRNQNGDIYKYVEDFTGTAHEFQLQGGLRANVAHKQTVANNFTDVFVPDTAQNSADWGGGTVQDGDTLEVSWTGSSTSKTLVYDAEVNEILNTIQWKNERSKFSNRTFEVGFNVPPINYGNDLYWQGDVLISKSGYKFLANKPLNNSGVYFTGLGWVRSPRTFIIESNLPYTPFNGDENGIPDGSWSFSGNVSTMVGDKLVINVTGSTTGKQVAYDVVGGNSVTDDLSAPYNPNPIKFHVSSEIGRPNLNDADYSTGDFIDSSTTGWRYGPYVEGQTDNALAWPDFVKLTQTTRYTDKTTSVIHEIEVDNGEFYFLEK